MLKEKTLFMNLKNLFGVVATFVFATILFVSCEIKDGNGTESDDKDMVYLYGNCTDPVNSREDGRFGMNQPYTMATATLLSGIGCTWYTYYRCTRFDCW